MFYQHNTTNKIFLSVLMILKNLSDYLTSSLLKKKVQFCYSAAHNVAVNLTDMYSLCTDLGWYVSADAVMDAHERKETQKLINTSIIKHTNH